jgi:single-strand DNA-binding protein
MIQASIYGRLGKEPQARQTKSGNDMALSSIAVDATPYNADKPSTVWFNVVAFGKAAELLTKHDKGDMVALSGKVTQSRWAGQDGITRESLSIMADTILSARTARGQAKRQQIMGQAQQEQQPPMQQQRPDVAPF